MKTTEENKPSSRNYVAKYAREFNKATVQEDRKKSAKRGKVKHKGRELE